MRKLDSTRMPLSHERIPLPDIYVDNAPVLIFDRGTVHRSKGEALRDNIETAKWVMEFVKPLFGPMRLNKLMTVQEGRSTLTYLTSDLRTLFRKVKINHPLASFLMGAGIAVSKEKGDGAVSALLLAGRILQKCERLLDIGIHPNIIIDGVIVSYRKVIEVAESLGIEDLPASEALRQGLRRSITGKLPIDLVDHFTELLYGAIELIGCESLESEGSSAIDFKKVTGGAVSESKLVPGVAITMEIPHHRMPREVDNAKIAAIRGELRLPNKKLNRYTEYSFTFEDGREMSRFMYSKKTYLQDLADKALGAGANVIIVEKGIDDLVLEYLAARGVLAIRGIPPPEFDRVAKAVGATITTHLGSMTREELGWAEKVYEEEVGKERFVLITGCRNPGTVDIVLRGSPKIQLDDIERVLRGALLTARAVLKDARMVWGGGAFEAEIALRLRRYAETLVGKVQLVVNAVAAAFEGISAALGKSVGMRESEIIPLIRSLHAQGAISAGIDLDQRRVVDKVPLGLRDPLTVKLQSIRSAFEAALTILRIDEYIVHPELPDPERHYVERIKKTSKQKVGEEEAS